MKFTCYIQKVDFFIDQFEDKGEVNLDQAIDIFQSFPFESQIEDAKKNESSLCLPTVSFNSIDGKTLNISASNGQGFSLHYENDKHFSDFFLSNEFEKNPQGLAVEQFIELFFNEKIEHEINLIERDIIEERIDETDTMHDSSNRVTFSFENTYDVEKLSWAFPYFVISLIILYIDSEVHFHSWPIHLFFISLWLPGVIVHVSYWFKNKDAIVHIDKKTKTITYERKGQQIIFNRTDIYTCNINKARSLKAPWSKYGYIWFVLNDRREIVITNFIAEPEQIINALKPNYKVEERGVPFLPL